MLFRTLQFRQLRPLGLSYHTISADALFLLLEKYQSAPDINNNPTTPPTTPPAIAPVLLEELDDVDAAAEEVAVTVDRKRSRRASR